MNLKEYKEVVDKHNFISNFDASKGGYNSEVIALVPVATNTLHWKMFVFGNATNICFFKDTRLKFFENGYISLKGAPMACALVYWGLDNSLEFDVKMEEEESKQRFIKFHKSFSKLGSCVDISNLIRARYKLDYE